MKLVTKVISLLFLFTALPHSGIQTANAVTLHTFESKNGPIKIRISVTNADSPNQPISDGTRIKVFGICTIQPYLLKKYSIAVKAFPQCYVQFKQRDKSGATHKWDEESMSSFDEEFFPNSGTKDIKFIETIYTLVSDEPLIFDWSWTIEVNAVNSNTSDLSEGIQDSGEFTILTPTPKVLSNPKISKNLSLWQFTSQDDGFDKIGIASIDVDNSNMKVPNLQDDLRMNLRCTSKKLEVFFSSSYAIFDKTNMNYPKNFSYKFDSGKVVNSKFTESTNQAAFFINSAKTFATGLSKAKKTVLIKFTNQDGAHIAQFPVSNFLIYKKKLNAMGCIF